MMACDRAEALFRERFGTRPDVIARAPGRVNIIGEHVDYNDGLVLPIAIDLYLVVCARRRADNVIQVHSAELNQTVTLQPGTDHRNQGWSSYVAGVAELVHRAGGDLTGADLIVVSDLPQGGGLSSSAALEAASALALMALGRVALPPERIATLCRAAEHEWAGVQCGIMDQYAVLLARENHALLLDCQSLEYEHVPIPREAHFVILDSGASRELAQSAYNIRVAECHRAATLLGVASLRDLDATHLDELLTRLPDPLDRRVRHVVTETARVQQAADALRRGELNDCGALMSQSHESLRDDYEVSSPALDAVVAGAERVQGVLGCRLTGAGFGGFAIALAVESTLADTMPQSRRVAPASGATLLQA